MEYFVQKCINFGKNFTVTRNNNQNNLVIKSIFNKLEMKIRNLQKKSPILQLVYINIEVQNWGFFCRLLISSQAYKKWTLESYLLLGLDIIFFVEVGLVHTFRSIGRDFLQFEQHAMTSWWGRGSLIPLLYFNHSACNISSRQLRMVEALAEAISGLHLMRKWSNYLYSLNIL